jgi:hypothetical protein
MVFQSVALRVRGVFLSATEVAPAAPDFQSVALALALALAMAESGER